MSPEELRSHLERLEISQASFARALGYPPRTIERYLADRRIPGWLARLVRVADRELIERMREAA